MRAIRKDLATRLKLQISQETKVRIFNPQSIQYYRCRMFIPAYIISTFHIFFLYRKFSSLLNSILEARIDHLLWEYIHSLQWNICCVITHRQMNEWIEPRNSRQVQTRPKYWNKKCSSLCETKLFSSFFFLRIKRNEWNVKQVELHGLTNINFWFFFFIVNVFCTIYLCSIARRWWLEFLN